jgi:hypothetical protein
MGGLVKGVKKAFKAVGGFVKKYWKPILMAAAIYFTAGIALAYFAPTAGFAAAMPGFGAGGMFSGAATWMGFGGAAGASNVAAGLGIFGNAAGAGAAVAGGLGAGAAAVGEGALAPGAAVAGDLGLATAAPAAVADMGGAGVMLGGTSAGALEAATGTAVGAAQSASAVAPAFASLPAAGSSALPNVANAANAAKDTGSFWGSMSGGEKMQLASTAFQGISGLLKPGPTKKDQGLWPGGAYFGMDEKGNGTDLGAVYKNAMEGSEDSTELSASAKATGSASDQPVTQAKPGAPGEATQSGQVAALAAGGAPATAQAGTAPAAAAQTGSPFLSAGGAAQGAQQATAQQSSALDEMNKANNAFIQKTYADLDPTKRRAS